MTAPAGSIAARARGRDNNFNLVRLCAAGLVLLSHSWSLSGTPGEPFERFAGFSFGHLGVDVFFVVSGFLVTGSLLSRGSLPSFLRARSLRIFPALVASAFGTALVVGPLVTTLPVSRYFAAWDTWRYALQNSTTWPWGVRWVLPGVYEHLPSHAVNGALWSLPWELTMYSMLAVLGALALGARPVLARAGLHAAIVGLAVAATLGHGLNEAFAFSQRFEVVQGLRLVALFFSAASFTLFRDRVPLSPVLFLASLALLFGSLAVKGAALALYPVTLSYAVVWLALVPGGVLRLYNRLGDYSYGFYLWQFPIQQWIMLRRPATSQPELLLLSLPAALALAVASWHLVEAPALSLKDPASGAPTRAGRSPG